MGPIEPNDNQRQCAQPGQAHPPVNTTANQAGRWVKGQSGNPAGKPRGTRNRATRLMEELLDGEAEAIGRKVVELAKQGDATALRLVLDRLLPPRRERPIEIALPSIASASDAVSALSTISTALAAGELTASEAASLSGLVSDIVRAIGTTELTSRVAALEAALKGSRS